MPLVRVDSTDPWKGISRVKREVFTRAEIEDVMSDYLQRMMVSKDQTSYAIIRATLADFGNELWGDVEVAT